MQPESTHPSKDLWQMAYWQIPLAGLASATACLSFGGSFYLSIGFLIASLSLAVAALQYPSRFTPLAHKINQIIRKIATWLTWILLLLVFFLILTPYAILLRRLGHRPLQSEFDQDSTSYWKLRKLPDSKTSYLRQF
ncbi:MAG: hypothetical protein MK106_00560 [Mariniblastus sp.]|nr:hypothetical protein [Mariniblastus sp.]